MKSILLPIKRNMTAIFLVAFTSMLLLLSCGKDNLRTVHKDHGSGHSWEVLDKWMSLQLRLIKNTTGVPNQAFSRHFAYSGIAAFESLSPGLTGVDKKWSDQWNGLTGLPVAANGQHYFFPANVNAAMAKINRLFFPGASVADKAAIDSLENALQLEFLQVTPAAEINRSTQFGRDVATAVFNWAETDGYQNASAPYTIPVGPGLWKPTAPSMAAPLTPYWGNNRPVIRNSTKHSMPAPPPVYSTDPSSPFYRMVKQVYDASLTLTDDQKAMAMFWRDVPGATSPGHWLSILQQVMNSREISLDKAALAYAIMGSAINDALITCFKAKYHYNLVRPITYIREVMGYDSWNTFIGTPAHPEYPSAHASLSSAAAAVMVSFFGNQQPFTDHTYDYMGMAPRTYTSFMAIGEEAGMSRFYPGIHYQQGVQAGLIQGRKVVDNIFSKD
jgi:hypothetical protein